MKIDSRRFDAGSVYAVSAEFAQAIASRLGCVSTDQVVTVFAECGVGLMISPSLPVMVTQKELPPVSLDRFSEFEAADMVWAEALGLARWARGPVHCICIDQRALRNTFGDPLSFKISEPEFPNPFVFLR